MQLKVHRIFPQGGMQEICAYPTGTLSTFPGGPDCLEAAGYTLRLRGIKLNLTVNQASALSWRAIGESLGLDMTQQHGHFAAPTKLRQSQHTSGVAPGLRT